MTQQQNQNQRFSSSRKKRARRTRYAEVTIAALTGTISATHLFDPTNPESRASTSGIWPLEHALEDLAPGGYVIDLRPLARHPKLTSWAIRAPIPNGRLEGDEIERFPEGVREEARGQTPALADGYRWLTRLLATGAGEPADGSAGPFDGVSAESLAAYWGSRGALIGKRRGRTIYWSDGSQQVIGPAKKQGATRPSSPKEPEA
jgi:hypothetical protein